MITWFKEKKNIIFLITSIVLIILCILYWRDTVSPYTTVFFIFLLLVFAGIFLMVFFKVKTKIIMSVMLIVFAGAFFFATPNGSMHDEELHFYRAFQISQGHLISPKIDGVGGDMLPDGISDFTDDTAELDYSNPKEVLFPTASIYSPLAYLPQVIGIRIARFFTANVYTIFLCGRLGVLILSLLLSLWAIRKMPFACEIMFLLMMFPMTLQEFVNMSADGLTISLAFAFTAYVLNLSYSDRKITVKDIVFLFIMSMWLSVIKICYVAIALLVLIIPKERFDRKNHAVIFKLSLIAASVLFIAGWMLIVSSLVAAGQRGDVYGQARYILTNLPSFFTAVVRTFHANSNFYVSTMAGSKLGALNVTTSTLMWVICLIMLVYQAAVCKSAPEKPHRFDLLIFLIIFISGTVMLFIGLYAQWTKEIGNVYVEGVQGRYFTPMILLLLFFMVYRGGQNKMFSGSYYYMLIAFTNSIALLDLMRAYG